MRNFIGCLVVIVCGLFMLGVGSRGTSSVDTRGVADQYVKVSFDDLDLERVATLLAEDVWFEDPTAIRFGGQAGRAIKGRDKFLAAQVSWDIADMDFEQDVSLACGEFACFAGALTVTITGRPPIKDTPFATILQVRDEKVIRRFDYADYTTWFRRLPAGPEPELESVAKKYLQAYVKRHPDDMAKLLADDAVYHDLTASVLGEDGRVEGREAIIDMIQGTAGVVLGFEFAPARSFFFEHSAVFAGDARVSLAGAAIEIEQERVDLAAIPMFVVLRIEGGKVVKHEDYVDYEDFLKQVETLKSPEQDE